MFIGTFTIFAPNNDAFSALPPATLTALGNDVAALTNVLKYHVVPGNIPSSAVRNELQLDSLNGQKIRLNDYDHNNVILSLLYPDFKNRNFILYFFSQNHNRSLHSFKQVYRYSHC